LSKHYLFVFALFDLEQVMPFIRFHCCYYFSDSILII
jgi:hypothetical protein